MSSLTREVPKGHQLRRAQTAWRERGYRAGRSDGPCLEGTRLVEVAGEAGARVYLEGLRAGKRERARAEASEPTTKGER